MYPPQVFEQSLFLFIHNENKAFMLVIIHLDYVLTLFPLYYCLDIFGKYHVPLARIFLEFRVLVETTNMRSFSPKR